MKDFPDLQNENAILPLTTASFPDFPLTFPDQSKKDPFPLTSPDRINPEGLLASIVDTIAPSCLPSSRKGGTFNQIPFHLYDLDAKWNGTTIID